MIEDRCVRCGEIEAAHPGALMDDRETLCPRFEVAAPPALVKLNDALEVLVRKLRGYLP